MVRPDAEAVVGRTLALALSDADALTVDAADAVDAAPFPISATEVTLVGIAPTIIAAVALDTSAQGSGVQEDDQVLLVFSSGTNGHAIDAENIDAVLQLSDGHSWRSGGGAIGEAVWTSDVDENDTLTILLSTAGGKPTIAVGDAITIAAGTIQDPAGAVDAVATPRLLAGSFGSGESYEAYTDYLGVAGMVEELVAHLAEAVTGSTRVPWGERTIELAPPWRRLTVAEAVQEHAGVDLGAYRSEEALRGLLREQGIAVPEQGGWAKLFDALMSERVEPALVQPTFLLDWPVETTPLAKRTAADASLVERFEAFMVGWEVANAYSELNDPDEQRTRFAEQRALQAAGDEEAELGDEDFLVALEHGMPPTGGLGIGIDRLVMVLTNSPSIRDVILFPQLRRS